MTSTNWFFIFLFRGRKYFFITVCGDDVKTFTVKKLHISRSNTHFKSFSLGEKNDIINTNFELLSMQLFSLNIHYLDVYSSL